jgi:hypothetical protein
VRASPIEMYGVSQASPDVTKRGHEPLSGESFVELFGVVRLHLLYLAV